MREAGNWSKVPNEIIDALATMDGAGAKVAAVLVRQTFGYQRQECRLTWSDLQEATGLSRGGVSIGLRVVAEYGWFVGRRRSVWRVTDVIWKRLYGKTVYSVDQNGQRNSLDTRPESTDKTKAAGETVYSVDQNELDHSLITRPPSITERETPSGFREEKEDPAPPPDDYEQAVWDAAERIVRRWCEKRAIYRRLSSKNDGTGQRPDDRADFYAPATRIVHEFGGDEAAAWGAIRDKYNDMLAAGFSPKRLAPVVEQILADKDRLTVPARASPNGNGQHATQMSRDEIIAQALDDLGDW